MNYSYKAYLEDDPEPLKRIETTDGRKIKETVTINITIELEKSKYYTQMAKYKEPIPEKILKLFK